MRAPLAILVLASMAGCASASERCHRAGGSWFTSAMSPHRGGACLMPSTDGGKACRNGSECASAWCACPDNPFEGGPHRLDDGAEATGTCAAFPARSGAGWMCVVEGGRIVRRGIIVD